MSVVIEKTGVLGDVGSHQRMRVWGPGGVNAGGVNLTEQVNGAAVGLGVFNGSVTLALTDSTSYSLTQRYYVEVRQVGGAFDDTAFDAAAAADVTLSKEPIGWVINGALVTEPPAYLAEEQEFNNTGQTTPLPGFRAVSGSVRATRRRSTLTLPSAPIYTGSSR